MLFFVFLGLTFQLQFNELVGQLTLATGFVTVLILTRVISVYASTAHSELSGVRVALVLLSAQGVTQATLAIIALNVGMPLEGSFLALTAYVIILTNLITTAGSVWLRTRRSRPLPDFEQSS